MNVGSLTKLVMVEEGAEGRHRFLIKEEKVRKQPC